MTVLWTIYLVSALVVVLSCTRTLRDPGDETATPRQILLTIAVFAVTPVVNTIAAIGAVWNAVENLRHRQSKI